MKPKKTITEKKETTKKKNKRHWETHRREICSKRNQKKLTLTQGEQTCPSDVFKHLVPDDMNQDDSNKYLDLSYPGDVHFPRAQHQNDFVNDVSTQIDEINSEQLDFINQMVDETDDEILDDDVAGQDDDYDQYLDSVILEKGERETDQLVSELLFVFLRI